jgi:hypothetical protein
MDQGQPSKGSQMKAEKLVNLIVRAVALSMRYGDRMAIFYRIHILCWVDK